MRAVCLLVVAIAGFALAKPKPDIGLELRKPLATSYGVPSESVTGLPAVYGPPSPTFIPPLVSTAVPFYSGPSIVTPTIAPVFYNQGFVGAQIPSQVFQQSSHFVTHQQPAQVQKHVYFYEAPSEPEEIQPHAAVAQAPAKKNVKIIFIRAPTYNVPVYPQALYPQQQDKTIVYVLVKKPEAQEPIVIEQPAPTPPAKPEVYFIKYKNQQEAEEKVQNTLNSHAESGANVITNNIETAPISDSFITGLPLVSTSAPLGLVDGGFFGTSTAGPIISSSYSPFSPGVSITSNGVTGHYVSSTEAPTFISSTYGPPIELAPIHPTYAPQVFNSIISSTESPFISSTESPFISSTESQYSSSTFNSNIDVNKIPDTYGPPPKPHETYGAPRGWKVLRNWNKDDYNAADLLENLHVQHGVSPYFKISVVPHHNSPGSSIIRISPSGLGLPDRNYYFNRENDDAIEKAYIHFISDVVINLSTTKEEADRFGRDLYYYEKRIAEITPESGEFQDPIKTYDIRTIQELRRTVPQLRIHEILPRMYPEANINELTEVVLTSAQYLEEVATISSTTDKIASNSYFIWTLVREYLPYLNAKFAASWNSFNHAILGIQKPPERWEFCVNLAQRFMGLVVEAFLERKKPITNSTRSVVNEVYESIRQTVSKRLDTFQSMPNLHSHLTNKLKTLELEIGLPQNISTEEYLKFFYKKMNVVRKSFFNNYKKGVTFLKKVEERRLISSHTQDYTLSYIYSKPSFVQYSPSVNKIVVPSILLSNFYFEDKYPWSVIYGRVGVEIAQAVVSSVLPYDNVWTTDMKLLTQFHVTVNESMNVVQHSKNCILDFVIKGRYASEIVANLTVLDVVKTISAVQIAEEALNSITATKEHVHQPSFETMEDFQLFYLTYSQSLCSVTTEDYKLYNSLQNYRFPQKELLDVLWHQIPGFKQAFSCSTGSSKRCSDTF